MGKSIGTGFQVWPALEADPELLDEPIRPLVGALNHTTWARTIFSCAGHPEEPDSIRKGRRQAHVDVLVADLRRWQNFVAAVKRSATDLRVTEGSLGPVPEWLTDGGGSEGFQGAEPPAAPKARNSPDLARGFGGAQRPPAAAWHYRRLVIEPVPYDLPPDLCRQTLNTALATALSALRECPP